jgi:hypothetical protein
MIELMPSHPEAAACQQECDEQANHHHRIQNGFHRFSDRRSVL